MCGIAGFFRSSTLQRAHLRLMTESIAHRGPDGTGLHFDPKHQLGLGHRRLSIIDLSDAASQPMFDHSGRYGIVFNGEIYNYQEIKSDLLKRGHQFLTNSDTEVILEAFKAWGRDALFRFNGMWAFALYDTIERTLFLCRDRFGVKPLFYSNQRGGFLFGSELKCFLALSRFIPLHLSTRSIASSLASTGLLESSGETLLQEVHSLLPGHWISVTSQGDALERRWWNTIDHVQPTRFKNIDEAAEELRSLLKDATRLRLRSDVTVGTSLSGGLDSSAVTALVANSDFSKLENPYQAFVHEFPGEAVDESAYARKVLAHTRTKGIFVVQDPQSAVDVDGLVYQFESIYGSIPDAAFRIYQSQRAHRTPVALDGHGADELFGGYNDYLFERLFDKTALSPSFEDLLHFPARFADQAGYNLGTFGILKGLFRAGFFDREAGSALSHISSFSKLASSPFSKSSLLYEGVHTPRPLPAWNWHERLNEALYVDFHSRILPRLLHNFDYASMANSIEVRMPFLDYRVVCLAFSLPGAWKVGDAFSKLVVRKAMAPLLPAEICWRKSKTGFHSPVVSWIRGPMKDWFERSLCDQSPLDDLISRTSLRKTVALAQQARPEDPRSKAIPGLKDLWLYASARRLVKLWEDQHGVSLN